MPKNPLEHYDPEFEKRQEAKEAGVDEVKQFLIDQGTDPTNYLGLGIGKLGKVVGKGALAAYGMLKADDASAMFMGGKWLRKGAIEAAEKMLKAGKSDLDVFKLTGYFKNPKGEWRAYVPDKGSQVNPLAMYKNEAKLPDVLEHPNLYHVNPYAKDINVRPMPPDTPKNKLGQFDPNTRTISLNPRPDLDHLNVVGHELQHDVQKIGDLPDKGGGSLQALPEKWDAGAEKIKALQDRVLDRFEELSGIKSTEVVDSYYRAATALKSGVAPNEKLAKDIERLQNYLSSLDPQKRAQMESLINEMGMVGKARNRAVDIHRKAKEVYWNRPAEVEARATGGAMGRDLRAEGVHPNEVYNQNITDPRIYDLWKDGNFDTSITDLLPPY